MSGGRSGRRFFGKQRANRDRSSGGESICINMRISGTKVAVGHRHVI
jgi:hypothetical protein